MIGEKIDCDKVKGKVIGEFELLDGRYAKIIETKQHRNVTIIEGDDF